MWFVKAHAHLRRQGPARATARNGGSLVLPRRRELKRRRRVSQREHTMPRCAAEEPSRSRVLGNSSGAAAGYPTLKARHAVVHPHRTPRCAIGSKHGYVHTARNERRRLQSSERGRVTAAARAINRLSLCETEQGTEKSRAKLRQERRVTAGTDGGCVLLSQHAGRERERYEGDCSAGEMSNACARTRADDLPPHAKRALISATCAARRANSGVPATRTLRPTRCDSSPVPRNTEQARRQP